jgi:hypothetical protein
MVEHVVFSSLIIIYRGLYNYEANFTLAIYISHVHNEVRQVHDKLTAPVF